MGLPCHAVKLEARVLEIGEDVYLRMLCNESRIVRGCGVAGLARIRSKKGFAAILEKLESEESFEVKEIMIITLNLESLLVHPWFEEPLFF